MRKLGWLGVLAGVMALSVYTSTPVAGQQQQAQAMPRSYGTPPPMVITAFGGKPVTYKAPRTPRTWTPGRTWRTCSAPGSRRCGARRSATALSDR